MKYQHTIQQQKSIFNTTICSKCKEYRVVNFKEQLRLKDGKIKEHKALYDAESEYYYFYLQSLARDENFTA